MGVDGRHPEHAAGWTEDRVERLKALWREGKSATEIAVILGGGLSRNGVIGKVHRLKLDKRPTVKAKRPSGAKKDRGIVQAARKVDGEEVERTQKRKQVAQLNARHPELTPEEAAARLLMPLITLRTFTAELGIEWSAARRAEPPAPTERRPTKTERIRLMHEAHPTWTARMIANELGEKETTVSTLLAVIRRAERERAVEEVVEKEPVR